MARVIASLVLALPTLPIVVKVHEVSDFVFDWQFILFASGIIDPFVSILDKVFQEIVMLTDDTSVYHALGAIHLEERRNA
jgi:hypothetical protein